MQQVCVLARAFDDIVKCDRRSGTRNAIVVDRSRNLDNVADFEFRLGAGLTVDLELGAGVRLVLNAVDNNAAESRDRSLCENRRSAAIDTAGITAGVSAAGIAAAGSTATTAAATAGGQRQHCGHCHQEYSVHGPVLSLFHSSIQ